MQPTSADISVAFIDVTSWLSNGTTSVETPSIRSICVNPSIDINVNGCLVSFKPCKVKTKIWASRKHYNISRLQYNLGCFKSAISLHYLFYFI